MNENKNTFKYDVFTRDGKWFVADSVVRNCKGEYVLDHCIFIPESNLSYYQFKNGIENTCLVEEYR